VHAALDAGITFFDTADIYGDTRSEVFLGRALGKRREHVVIATKFGMAVDDQRRGARPEYVKQACEDSLRRLGTDGSTSINFISPTLACRSRTHSAH
jgi:Predicted oxidoreductases (related to aryl-alcohol dehydrogenases)